MNLGCKMRCSASSKILLCCYLMTLAMMLAGGQAYHFSQGWLPGGKRSPTTVDNDVSAVDSLSRLLQAEYNRRAATAVKQSVDASAAGMRPFTIITNPDQYTRFLGLVCD